MTSIWKDKIGADKYDVINYPDIPSYTPSRTMYLSRINGVGIGGFSNKREAIRYCKSFAKTVNRDRSAEQ